MNRKAWIKKRTSFSTFRFRGDRGRKHPLSDKKYWDNVKSPGVRSLIDELLVCKDSHTCPSDELYDQIIAELLRADELINFAHFNERKHYTRFLAVVLARDMGHTWSQAYSWASQFLEGTPAQGKEDAMFKSYKRVNLAWVRESKASIYRKVESLVPVQFFNEKTQTWHVPMGLIHFHCKCGEAFLPASHCPKCGAPFDPNVLAFMPDVR